MSRWTLTLATRRALLLGAFMCGGLACDAYDSPAVNFAPPASSGSGGVSSSPAAGSIGVPLGSGGQPATPPFDCSLLEGVEGVVGDSPPVIARCGNVPSAGGCTQEPTSTYYRYDGDAAACIPFQWPSCRAPGEADGAFASLNRCRALCERVPSSEDCPPLAPGPNELTVPCPSGTYCSYDYGYSSSSQWLCEFAGDRGGCYQYAASAIAACWAQQAAAIPEPCNDNVCQAEQAFRYIPLGVGCTCDEHSWHCVQYSLY